MEKIILENESFCLVLNENAQAESLVCKSTGEECLASEKRMPLFSVTQDRLYNNELKLSYPTRETTFPANRVRREGDKLIVGFQLVSYEAVISLRIEKYYIAFTLEDFLVPPDGFGELLMNTPPVAALRLLQLPVKKLGSFGSWLNVAFHDRAAVGVLATSPREIIRGEDCENCHVLSADALRDVKLKGCTAALILSETDGFMDAIAALEEDFDLPRGVQSRKDPRINASILWAREVDPTNIDTYIDYAKRGGFRLMLLHYAAFVEEGRAWSLCGNYDLKPCYPKGIEDVTAMLQKIKAAGITPGLHFLHTHIGLQSRYATPVPDHRLHIRQRFTLSKELTQWDTTIYVEECPEGAAMADGCRILRFGKELIAYTGYSAEYPYCFTGCQRGYNGTHGQSHEMGLSGGVLDVSEYCATSVYPDQNTDLQDEIADKLAKLYNAGFQFAYFDGSEGTHAPFSYHVANAQLRVYRKFDPPPIFCEGAAKSHFSWHMISGGNAFDIFKTPVFKQKLVEHPFSQAPRMKQDFTRLNFGWWQLYPDTQPDTYEFGNCLAAAWDCPVTLKATPAQFRENPRSDDILEVMRRWEDVRAKKWLTDKQKQALRNPNTEHILLMNEQGDYELVPYYRVSTGTQQIAAYVFERCGSRYAVCWHMTGSGKMEIHLPEGSFTYHDQLGEPALSQKKTGDETILPLSHRRYIKTDLPMEQLLHALETAKLR